MMDVFGYCLFLLIQRADVSDFKEDEIRSLSYEMTMKDLEDSKEPIKINIIKPEIGDFGINNKKDIFVYREDNQWKTIN